MNLTDIYMEGEYWARRIMRIMQSLDHNWHDEMSEEEYAKLTETTTIINNMLARRKPELLDDNIPLVVVNIE
jgi:hypothetical protein